MYKTMKSLALLLAICGSLVSAARAETVLTMGAAALSAGSLPIVVAEQKGLFEAEGIKIKKLDFKGGGPAVQALASGSLDLCICAADHALKLESRGLGGRVLIALADHHSYALMTPSSNSDVTNLLSLKNKKVGITSSGSLTDNTLRYAIKEAGLDPNRDFELIGIGGGGEMRAALQTGTIAAGMFTTPAIEVNLADKGKYKFVEDYRNMPYPAQDLVVTKIWLEKNPAAARAVARAVLKALELIQSDKAVLRAAVVQMFPKFSPQLVDTVTDDVAAGYLSKDGKMTEQSYELLVKVMQIADPTLHKAPYKDVVALQYLPK
jgi:NitT/TauT family transport system substrate-binding protein